MYLAPDDRAKVVSTFRRSLLKLEALDRPARFILRAICIWLLVLLALYALFAYRPYWDTNAAPPGPRAVDQGFGAMAFREYLARMTGTIPPECALTDPGAHRPVLIDPASNDHPPSTLPGTVLLLNAFGIGTESASIGTDPTYHPCAWRSNPMSWLAFVSLDTGSVQKTTALFLVVGLLLVRRSRLRIDIDAAAFPRADPLLDPHAVVALYDRYCAARLASADAEHDQANIERGEHPKTIADRDDDRGDELRLPLFPPTFVALDHEYEPQSEALAYGNRVRQVRASMTHSRQTEPFDLILDVLDRGVATGLVGEADDRTRVVVFEYRDRLLGRLWPAEYIVWFLPTIGFLGTIYGISVSLSRAKGLFAGGGDSAALFERNIQLVVDGLGVAFDTTSMALICSTILYFSLRAVQAAVADLVEAAGETLRNLLVRRMVDRTANPPAQPGG